MLSLTFTYTGLQQVPGGAGSPAHLSSVLPKLWNVVNKRSKALPFSTVNVILSQKWR